MFTYFVNVVLVCLDVFSIARIVKLARQQSSGAQLLQSIPIFQRLLEELEPNPLHYEAIRKTCARRQAAIERRRCGWKPCYSANDDMLLELPRLCKKIPDRNTPQWQLLKEEKDFFDKCEAMREEIQECLKYFRTNAEARRAIFSMCVTWDWIRWCRDANPGFVQSKKHHETERLMRKSFQNAAGKHLLKDFEYHPEGDSLLKDFEYHPEGDSALSYYKSNDWTGSRKDQYFRSRTAPRLGIKYLSSPRGDVKRCCVCTSNLCYKSPQFKDCAELQIPLCNAGIIDNLPLVEHEKHNFKEELKHLWKAWATCIEPTKRQPVRSRRSKTEARKALTNGIVILISGVQAAIRRDWAARYGKGNRVDRAGLNEDMQDDEEDEDAWVAEDEDIEDKCEQTVETRCGHQFCESCFRKSLKFSRKKCVVCRQTLQASGPIYGSDARSDSFDRDQYWEWEGVSFCCYYCIN